MSHWTICHKDVFDEVKHGVRHYAHFRCYLADGRKLHVLQAWQIKHFPVMLLKEFEQLNPDLTFKSDEVRRKLGLEERHLRA